MKKWNLPIGLISSEDIAVEQALRVLPWARSVVVDKVKKPTPRAVEVFTICPTATANCARRPNRRCGELTG